MATAADFTVQAFGIRPASFSNSGSPPYYPSKTVGYIRAWQNCYLSKRIQNAQTVTARERVLQPRGAPIPNSYPAHSIDLEFLHFDIHR